MALMDLDTRDDRLVPGELSGMVMDYPASANQNERASYDDLPGEELHLADDPLNGAGTAPKVKAELAEPIKALIEAEPSFGYRTVAGLLAMNKNTVQRIFQLKGWQVRKRAVGNRPRIEAKISATERPDERWSTDLCRVWGGRDGWLVLALVIDCHTRQLLGWHLARPGPLLRTLRLGPFVRHLAAADRLVSRARVGAQSELGQAQAPAPVGVGSKEFAATLSTALG